MVAEARKSFAVEPQTKHEKRAKLKPMIKRKKKIKLFAEALESPAVEPQTEQEEKIKDN